jgi:hypothetical protein
VGRNTHATLFAHAQQRVDQRSPGGHGTLNPVSQQVSLGGGYLDAGYHADAVARGQIARPQRTLQRVVIRDRDDVQPGPARGFQHRLDRAQAIAVSGVKVQVSLSHGFSFSGRQRQP